MHRLRGDNGVSCGSKFKKGDIRTPCKLQSKMVKDGRLWN